MNAYELIAASCLWYLDIQNLTIQDYEAFLKHVMLISIKTKDSYYTNCAHVAYVLAVQRLAEKEGLFRLRLIQVKALYIMCHNT